MPPHGVKKGVRIWS